MKFYLLMSENNEPEWAVISFYIVVGFAIALDGTS